jgi:hypothetical protein
MVLSSTEEDKNKDQDEQQLLTVRYYCYYDFSSSLFGYHRLGAYGSEVGGTTISLKP